MPMEPGQMLSHYRLAEKIGEGGMGVVWRADDTKLDRQVAIKLLPEELTRDPERLARFQREAKVLASLNHPNIAAIYELGQDDGRHFLALELVEGEDLAERMKRGVIPVGEAAALAVQIAEALEAAHENQVVHRDLKPQNVKLTPDGRIKVLDFGLAKVWAPEGSDTSLSFSPTITAGMTQAGVILGTAAYMSPEQARGQAVDKRSDIWAFGVLLYEMLVGNQLFAGDTATDILGAIVHRRPEWDRLPDETPPGLVRLLKRCLTQELPERLRDIGEARYALTHLGDEEAPAETAGPVQAPAAGGGLWKLLAGLFLLISAALLVAVVMSPESTPPVLRANIDPPEGHRLVSTADVGGPVRVSPDGRALAFVAQDDKAVSRVWVRALDSESARPVPGTEEGRRPFWSPDSRSLAFFSRGKLRRVPLDGGGALAVADAEDGRGGDWSPAGVIVFAPGPGATLRRVPAGGGESVELTDFEHGEVRESSHREPRFLPDGQHFLFLAQSDDTTDWKVYVGNVDGGKPHHVTRTSGGAEYAQGYLLVLRGTTLVAQAFDTDSFELSGDPMPVTEKVTLDSNYGLGVFSVASNGVLAYQSGTQVSTQLTWVSSSGDRLEAVGPPGDYDQFD
ncbi:MAG: protein kinase domain-containing protein, partial [Planctomycetota bacterium]